MEKLRVAITAGYAASKHAIALVHGISALPEAEVVLVLEVRTFSVKRIRQLLRMYGWRDAWEKFLNIFIASGGNRFEEEVLPIKHHLGERGVQDVTVRQICRRLKTNHRKVDSLNGKEALDAVKLGRVHVVVYAGGGILRSEFIWSARYGILNAHSGPLPFFRGMNGLEWTLFYQVIPEVTVHMIDGGIDTGPVLKRFPWSIAPGETLTALRGRSVVVEVESLLEVLSNFEFYFKNQQRQQSLHGLQFFSMHPFLRAMVGKRLKSGWTPGLTYEAFQQVKQRN